MLETRLQDVSSRPLTLALLMGDYQELLWEHLPRTISDRQKCAANNLEEK